MSTNPLVLSALAKLERETPPLGIEDLPNDRYDDSSWNDFRTGYGLTVPEITAVKNAKFPKADIPVHQSEGK